MDEYEVARLLKITRAKVGQRRLTVPQDDLFNLAPPIMSKTGADGPPDETEPLAHGWRTVSKLLSRMKFLRARRLILLAAHRRTPDGTVLDHPVNESRHEGRIAQLTKRRMTRLSLWPTPPANPRLAR